MHRGGMQPLPPAATEPSHPANAAEKRRLFRALQGANPVVRRALVLLANGRSVEQAAQAVGCHPRILRRHLEALWQGSVVVDL